MRGASYPKGPVFFGTQRVITPGEYAVERLEDRPVRIVGIRGSSVVVERPNGRKAVFLGRQLRPAMDREKRQFLAIRQMIAGRRPGAK